MKNINAKFTTSSDKTELTASVVLPQLTAEQPVDTVHTSEIAHLAAEKGYEIERYIERETLTSSYDREVKGKWVFGLILKPAQKAKKTSNRNKT